MQVREKEFEDQPWIEKMLRERWGAVQVIVHNEIFDAHLLPALVAGEREGLATFPIRVAKDGLACGLTCCSCWHDRSGSESWARGVESYDKMEAHVR